MKVNECQFLCRKKSYPAILGICQRYLKQCVRHYHLNQNHKRRIILYSTPRGISRIYHKFHSNFQVFFVQLRVAFCQRHGAGGKYVKRGISKTMLNEDYCGTRDFRIMYLTEMETPEAKLRHKNERRGLEGPEKEMKWEDQRVNPTPPPKYSNVYMLWEQVWHDYTWELLIWLGRNQRATTVLGYKWTPNLYLSGSLNVNQPPTMMTGCPGQIWKTNQHLDQKVCNTDFNNMCIQRKEQSLNEIQFRFSFFLSSACGMHSVKHFI